jgi:hypothetical protein
VTATAIAAVAPFEMPEKSSSASLSPSPSPLLSSGRMVGVAEVVGTSCVDVAGVVVRDVGADVLDMVELLDIALFPTAGGPSVSPSRAWAACLIGKAVSPESPAILKRFE